MDTIIFKKDNIFKVSITIKNMKKILIVGIFGILIVSSVIAFGNQDSEIVELTTSQINKMVELGVIQIYVDLPHNSNDKDTTIVYNTPNGDCYLYQDLFGRYYCRW